MKRRSFFAVALGALGAPVVGKAVVAATHPLLLEAEIKYQRTAGAELLPISDPGHAHPYGTEIFWLKNRG